MKMRHGWAFPDADEFMSAELGPNGEYQASHLDAALAFVTNFDAALDGGAHAGTWSRRLGQRFTRVIACEPSEDTHEALRANMAAFGCSNVEIRQCALGSSPGLVHMAPLDQRAEAMKNTGARFVANGGTIPRITIDALGLSSLGFLKLDIEGSEVDALMGGAKTIARCRPIVLYENKGFCRRFGYPKDGAAQVLMGLGYRQLQAVGTDLIWGPA